MKKKKQNLQNFAAGLKAILGEENNLRPFVCEGSPLECQAFIVGINAATELSAEFWEFWDPSYGFHKSPWEETYVQERRRRGKGTSPTRRIIERVVATANPVRILETYLYPSPTVAARNIPATQRHTATFDFLLTYIRPTAIVVHGDKAIDHLTRALNAKTLPEERFVAIPTSWGAVHVRAERHFSRGWSYARAEKLGVSLRRLCARLDGRVSTHKRKKT